LVFFLDGIKTIVPRQAAVILKVVTNPKLQHAHQRLKWFVIPIIPTAATTTTAITTTAITTTAITTTTTARATKNENKQK
jgi:hypothetical protein